MSELFTSMTCRKSGIQRLPGTFGISITTNLNLYLGLVEGREKLDILDVGCAQGTLALMLAERGHEVWAMDIRQQFLDYAAARHERGLVHFICGNAMEVELDQKFDLIFANQIVEHLVYPLEFTQRLASWLKPDGRLVMTTPNGEYIKNSLPSYSELGDVKQYAERQFTADGDGHFFAYYGAELKRIFEQAGLRNVSAFCFETPFISGHLKVRYAHSILPQPSSETTRQVDAARSQGWLAARSSDDGHGGAYFVTGLYHD